MFSYVGLKFQVNRSLGKHRNTGQQGLLNGEKSYSNIFRIVIFGFFLFFYFLLSLWVIITYLGQL
jgi:hypothetical protein